MLPKKEVDNTFSIIQNKSKSYSAPSSDHINSLNKMKKVKCVIEFNLSIIQNKSKSHSAPSSPPMTSLSREWKSPAFYLLFIIIFPAVLSHLKPP